jgi:hypothetical protein
MLQFYVSVGVSVTYIKEEHLLPAAITGRETLLVLVYVNALPAFSCLWARRSALLSFDICELCQYFWGRQNGANSRRPVNIITNFGFICCIVLFKENAATLCMTIFYDLIWIPKLVVDRPALFMCDWQYVKRQIEFSSLVRKISITNTHIASYCCYDRRTSLLFKKRICIVSSMSWLNVKQNHIHKLTRWDPVLHHVTKFH